MALTDCAPLVMAQELGLFEKRGLAVELSRELGAKCFRADIFSRALALATPALVPSAA